MSRASWRHRPRSSRQSLHSASGEKSCAPMSSRWKQDAPSCWRRLSSNLIMPLTYFTRKSRPHFKHCPRSVSLNDKLASRSCTGRKNYNGASSAWRRGLASCRRFVCAAAGALFLRVGRGLLNQWFLELPPRDNEIVVLSVAPPRARGHIAHLDKLPVSYVGRRKPKVIANSGRNIQPRAMV